MGDPAAQVIIASDPFAVREGLAVLLASPPIAGLGPNAKGVAEIVLAEVLNNIVEHAYANTTGEIVLSLQQVGGAIFVAVEDQGAAFPEGELPQMRLPDIDSADGLPEGGFGWFLIRTLVSGLCYRRNGATNHVSFNLPVGED